jgi:hypothetical protein
VVAIIAPAENPPTTTLERSLPDHQLRWRQLCRVQVQELDRRTDLREGEVAEVEDVSGAGLLDHLAPLPEELGLRLAHRLEGGVDEAGVVEPLPVVLQVLVVDAVPVWGVISSKVPPPTVASATRKEKGLSSPCTRHSAGSMVQTFQGPIPRESLSACAVPRGPARGSRCGAGRQGEGIGHFTVSEACHWACTTVHTSCCCGDQVCADACQGWSSAAVASTITIERRLI